MGASKEYDEKGNPLRQDPSAKKGQRKGGRAKGRAWTNFKVSAVIVNQYVPEKIE